jgi:hypothetical protein
MIGKPQLPTLKAVNIICGPRKHYLGLLWEQVSNYMPVIIPNSFVPASPAIAGDVNANFQAVKVFVDAIETGVNIDNSAITTAKIADNAITQAKLIDRAVGSAELDKITLNTQVGTTYTAVLTDAQKLVTLDNGSPITFTIPPNSSVAFQKGDQINLLQLGVGQVTVAAGVGVTLVAQGNKKKLNGQYAIGTCIKVDDANTWVIVGNTAI